MGKQNQNTSNDSRLTKLKWIGASLLMTVLFSFIMVGVTAYSMMQNVQIDETKLKMFEATVILDQEERVVAKLAKENRKYIPLSEIPEQVKNAILAVEDQRYYEHEGIDYRAIFRALYRDIVAGGKVEGGSTITQQLVKNVFLSHEKTWVRKIEEVFMALELEKRYSKDQILEMYLNYIYFGHGAYGIAAASEVYFDKHVDELHLNEIALLAALPKAPGHYSPLIEGNKDKSEQRRKLILSLMAEQGRITPAEKKEAENTPLSFKPAEPIENQAMWTYIDMVTDEAKEKYGLDSEELFTGGYHIYTVLDIGAQEAMYEAMRIDGSHAETFFPFTGPEQSVQGSMVIMNHQTGAVMAIMGGRDYVRRGYNRATSESRQPGSTFKPIAVYAPALEAGWEPFDWLKDEKITYPGKYTPRNYNDRYRGKVTMLEAVQQSYNAPAVWLLNELGIQKGIDAANAFGFNHVERKLGVALGDTKASPLQLANAFGTFGSNGVMTEPYFIEKIVDREGNVIAEHEHQQQRVVSEQTAWYMTTMLHQVVETGTASRAKLSKHPLAGKTGTTQSSQGIGVNDAWFVGYTPQFVAAVWMGFDGQKEGHVMETTGGNHPALLFKHVMDIALTDQSVLHFVKPEGVGDPFPKQVEKKNEKEKKKGLYNRIKKEEEKRKDRDKGKVRGRGRSDD